MRHAYWGVPHSVQVLEPEEAREASEVTHTKSAQTPSARLACAFGVPESSLFPGMHSGPSLCAVDKFISLPPTASVGPDTPSCMQQLLFVYHPTRYQDEGRNHIACGHS